MKHMRTTVLFAVLLMFVSGMAKSQEVIAPAGADASNENMSISWTVGELAIETLAAGDIILTQGFHQPATTVVSVDELPDHPANISAFPNPATDYVHIQIADGDHGDLHYAIYDFRGSVVMQGELTGDMTQLSLAGMQPATYFVKVFEGHTELKTFKLIKQ